MYPIVKRTKTSLGEKIPDGYLGFMLYYCPVCNKRLSGKKLNGNEPCALFFRHWATFFLMKNFIRRCKGK